jgi:hypothetical protein
VKGRTRWVVRASYEYFEHNLQSCIVMYPH